MTKSEQGQRPLVPRLRFPKFQGSAGWHKGRIADIAEVLQGYGFPERYQGQTTGEYPFYKVSDISNTLAAGKMFIEESVNYITKDILKELKAKPIPEGTTIFAKIGEAIKLNRRAVTTQPCLIDNNAAGVKAIQGKSTDLFVYFTMETIALIDYSGGVVPSINKSAIENIYVTFPAIEEQKKIASFLSSLDDMIAAEIQKLEMLKTHKKGLMQELFPRERNNIPQVRFPEFEGAAPWSKIIAGNLFSNRLERGNKGLPIYSVTMTEGLVPRASLDRKIDDIAEAGANKTVRAGDLAYNMMRMWQGALGLAPEDCMVSPAYIVLAPHEVNPLFFYYLLKQPHMLRVLTAHSRGLTEDRLRLYYDDFAKISLLCPERSEQDRIADFLSSTDKLIAAQQQGIEVLKTHKKSLLQQLFPVLEEVQA